MSIYSLHLSVVDAENRAQRIKECYDAGISCWNRLYPLINEMAAVDGEIRERLKILVEKEHPMEKGARAWDTSLHFIFKPPDPYFTDQEAEFIIQIDEFWLAQKSLFIEICEISHEYAERFPHLRTNEKIAERKEVLRLIQDEFLPLVEMLKVSRAKSLAQGAQAIEELATVREVDRKIKRREDEITLGELAGRCGITSEGVRQRIERLINMGWLDPSDLPQKHKGKRKYYSPEHAEIIVQNPRTRKKKL